MVRTRPATLQDLMTEVQAFAEGLDEQLIRKSVQDIRFRADLCVKEQGSHFEHKVKRSKRALQL